MIGVFSKVAAASLFATGGAAPFTGRFKVLPLFPVLLSGVSVVPVPASGTGVVVVGVKVIEQLFSDAPAAKEADVAGQPLDVAPDGLSVKSQEAFAAAAVALALLVQVMVQVTACPTVAGFGTQLIVEVKSAFGSSPTVICLVAVLLAGLLSLSAPVLPVTVTVPAVVGVPVTWQVTVSPTGTLLPLVHAALLGLIAQAPCVTPAGKSVTAQVAFVAAAVALALLVQVNVPV